MNETTTEYNLRRLHERRPDIWSHHTDDHRWTWRGDEIVTWGPVEVVRLKTAVRQLLKIALASPSETTRRAACKWTNNHQPLTHRAHGHIIEYNHNKQENNEW